MHTRPSQHRDSNVVKYIWQNLFDADNISDMEWDLTVLATEELNFEKLEVWQD